MFNKIIIALSFILASSYGLAQKDINNYKYIIVPKSYEFSKTDDQYQLNSLLKFLFNKYGYEAYFIDELTEDLKKEGCLALTSQVSNEKKGMFKTKLEIILKDCYGNEVMTSKVGESRVKDFKKAHTEALRDAFETFKNFDYNYVAQAEVTERLKTDKELKKEVTKIEDKKEVVLIETDKKKKVIDEVSASPKDTKLNLYYAQEITNGFQLVNSEPRVVMILFNTSAKEVFIVKDKNAIVYKKEGKWFYSENDGTVSLDKELNIKF